MALTPGTRLGVYEVTEQIGEGGMGQVYRATDTRLKRQVAIKVLPPSLAGDHDRLARFQREAEVLASLNHPHIASIYGLEESGGVSALVMELVDGEDLSQRIARGAIPLDEALPIAKQITDALEAAHDQGIIHRDLKPANIKVRSDGTVKVLDFGLAKAMDVGADAAGGLSLSPTIMSPALMSGVGVILGTAAYMAPEQARGRAVDKRADIWAFGVVVYEMLTGQPPFPGETVTDVIAAVVTREPDWKVLVASTPPALRTLLERCLRKDPKARLRDIGDARLELADVHGQRAVAAAPAPAFARPKSHERLVWASVVALLAITLVVVARPRSLPVPPLMRVDISTPPTQDPASLAVAPDGRSIVYAALTEGVSRLWIRTLESAEARMLPGTDDARLPFWSPDGTSIGFFANGKLRRVEVAGGAPQILANAGAAAGGTWGPGGLILFAPNSGAGPIYRTSASGGDAKAVTENGSGGHQSPQLLPDGQHFIFTAGRGDSAGAGVMVARTDGSDRHQLIDADEGRLSAAGFLLFRRQQTWFAQPFDFATLSLTGTSSPFADNISIGQTIAAISVSQAGTVAYRKGESTQAMVGLRQLAWFNRLGVETAKVGEPMNAANPALSPDGRRIALQHTVDSNGDIWLMDTLRGVLSRFTTDPAFETHPLWSPDGRRVVFGSRRGGINQLYSKAADGSEAETPLLPPANIGSRSISDWSRDGRFLLLRTTQRDGANQDIWAVQIDPPGEPFPVVATPFEERDAQFSPDGNWIAYQSNESGRFEIYVQPFPGPGGRERISTAGGAQVRWRSDGKELFFIGLDERLMAVPIALDTQRRRVEAGSPVPLFKTQVGGAVPGVSFLRQQYMVSRDGERFLMLTVLEDAIATPITLVINWKPK